MDTRFFSAPYVGDEHGRRAVGDFGATIQSPRGKRVNTITEKESFKWLQGLNGALPASKPVITIGDREADVYELFQYAHNVQQHFIVRAIGDRRIKHATSLNQHLRQLPVHQTDNLPVQRHGRTANDLRHA